MTRRSLNQPSAPQEARGHSRPSNLDPGKLLQLLQMRAKDTLESFCYLCMKSFPAQPSRGHAKRILGSSSTAGHRWVTRVTAFAIAVVAIAAVLGWPSGAGGKWGKASAQAAGLRAHLEREDLGYFTVVDERGREILHTGLVVSIGDRFIAPDEREYEIVSIVGDEARARALSRSSAAGAEEAMAEVPVEAAQAQAAVGIYHTHSDESYVPSDGTASIRGAGGVIRVGQALASALMRRGIRAIHDTTPHDPHDAGAYDRSRRTAANLLKQKPAALFDVHRDTGPAEVYQQSVAGKTVTKIMMVVGRQNPNMGANLAFAKRLKSVVDARHPGLIKGILVTDGKFNQDLHPRALLLEVGSLRTPREDAEQAVTMLADDVPAAVGGAPQTPGASGESRQGLSALGRLIVLALIVGVAYLFASTGGWKEAKAKIRRLATQEFSGWLGGGRLRSAGHPREPGKPEDAPGGQRDEAAGEPHDEGGDRGTDGKDSA